MFQYKAVLQHSQEIIAEGHNLDDLEAKVLHYKRQQKYGEHTNMNNKVDLIHNLRDKVSGQYKEKIIKSV